MATIPSQATKAVGEKVSAALWNDDVRDAVDYLLDPPRCQVYQATGQTFTNGAAAAAVTFDAETYDSDGMHDNVTNNSRITFVTAGTYILHVYTDLPAATYTVYTVTLRINGTTSIRTLAFVNPAGGFIRFTIERAFSASDYLEVLLTQTSGANRVAATGNNVTGVTARWVAQ